MGWLRFIWDLRRFQPIEGFYEDVKLAMIRYVFYFLELFPLKDKTYQVVPLDSFKDDDIFKYVTQRFRIKNELDREKEHSYATWPQ